MYIYIYINIYIDTHTHAHTHTHTHTHTHIHTPKHTHANTRTHAHRVDDDAVFTRGPAARAARPPPVHHAWRHFLCDFHTRPAPVLRAPPRVRPPRVTDTLKKWRHCCGYACMRHARNFRGYSSIFCNFCAIAAMIQPCFRARPATS